MTDPIYDFSMTVLFLAGLFLATAFARAAWRGLVGWLEANDVNRVPATNVVPWPKCDECGGIVGADAIVIDNRTYHPYACSVRREPKEVA